MKKAVILLLFLAQFAHALSFVHIATLDGTEAGGGWARFADPKGLAVDSENRLYVADSGSNRIVIYESNLSYLSMRGGVLGSGREEMDSPEGVWVASGGRIYIADTYNHRIQIFTGYSGAWYKTIPTGSGESYDLERPSAVAVDSDGNMHVADTFHNRVQVFSPTGLFLRSIHSPDPFGNYVFNKPRGVFIDRAGERILLADTENNRVQVFDMNYTFIGRLGWGEGNEGFLQPRAAAADAFGRIYVADTGNDRIQVFSGNLTFITSISGQVGGSVNATSSSFGSPQGVVIDQLGRLFVSDGSRKRVLVFKMVDVELEAQYARNKIDAARAAVGNATQSAAVAQANVDGIAGSGCGDGGSASAYALLAQQRLATANDSLASAEAMMRRQNYTSAAAHADSAFQFAGEAEQAAADSARYAVQFNESAGGAVAEMAAVNALFAEAEGLNATAARLNVTLRNLSALDTAQFSYGVARVRCGEANYIAAQQDAAEARGNASAAVGSMRQQINIAIIPIYTQLMAEFALAQGNITLYDLPIDTAPLEIELSLANTLILDSRYEEALAKLESARTDLVAVKARVESSTVEVGAQREGLRAAVNTTRQRASALADLALNYSLQIDFSRANILTRQAEANLSLDQLPEANTSLGQANLELDRLNASLQERMVRVANATAAIAQAKDDVARAERASLLLLRADTGQAHADIAAAEAELYSNPEDAQALAARASESAKAEEARLGAQKPMLVGFAAAVIIAGIVVLLVLTGAAAGVYALVRHVQRTAREEAKKLQEAAKEEALKLEKAAGLIKEEPKAKPKRAEKGEAG